MRVEPGQRLSHYVLLEEIGAGGMGVVYRARDEHLDRDVAVKVLHPDRLVDEAARERLRKEGLALSRLSHPNVETVHDLDTEGGIDFLVMELIPGQTLTERLLAGPLPQEEVVRLGARLAKGLTAAHEQGILHQDLKPNNVRLTPDGQLKILDFGLARLLKPEQDPDDAETASDAEAVVGTMPYMAPEQLRGAETDPRTDLYAAGAVLYEMATGRRPHPERRAPTLIDAILHDAPDLPSTVSPAVSPELERIILKCLDKDPERRYQSARELGVDLRRLASAHGGQPRVAVRPGQRRWLPAFLALAALLVAGLTLWPGLDRLRHRLLGHDPERPIQSLAVLPFTNLMDDPTQQYFVDGMHEALIANLARIGALRVISRTSVMQYRNPRRRLTEIARELGVDAIVEGSVLRAGDSVRITAQLVDGTTDTHLWTETYDGDLRDILRLQGETARAIADEIRVVVTAPEAARLAVERPVDRAAYDAYLKGRYHLNSRTEEEIVRSLDFFQESIALDPDYPLAHAALAEASLLTGWYSWVEPRVAFPAAQEAAQRALELDGSSAEAHTVAAAVHMLWDWDLGRAEAEFRRAIQIEPGYARAHHWYALYLSYMLRYEESIAEIRRAQELDPLSLIIHTIAGLAHCQGEHFEEAVREAQKTLEMNPDFPFAHNVLACGYEGLEMYDEALAARRRALELTHGVVEVADLARAYAEAGQREQALELLAELEERALREYVAPMSLAAVYLALGRHQESLDWLERAYDEHAWDLVFLHFPVYDPLRSDPRFQELERRVGAAGG